MRYIEKNVSTKLLSRAAGNEYETKAVDEVAKRPEAVSKQPSDDFSEGDRAAARCSCLWQSADSRGLAKIVDLLILPLAKV